MPKEENTRNDQKEMVEQRWERQKEELQQRKKVIEHFTMIQKRIAAKKMYEKILKEQIDTINTEIAIVQEKQSAEHKNKLRVLDQQEKLLEKAIEEQEQGIAEQKAKAEKILKKWESAIGEKTLEKINKAVADYSEKQFTEIKKAADSRIEDIKYIVVEQTKKQILEEEKQKNKERLTKEIDAKVQFVKTHYEKEVKDTWEILKDQIQNYEKFYNKHKGVFDTKYFDAVGKTLHMYEKSLNTGKKEEIEAAEKCLQAALQGYEDHIKRKKREGKINREREERLKFVQELKESIVKKNTRIEEAENMKATSLSFFQDQNLSEKIIEDDNKTRFEQEDVEIKNVEQRNHANKTKREEEEKKNHEEEETYDHEFMIWNEQQKKMMTEQEEIAYVKELMAAALNQELKKVENDLDVERFMETGEIYNAENPEEKSGLLKVFNFSHKIVYKEKGEEKEYGFKKAEIADDGRLVAIFGAEAMTEISLVSMNKEFFLDSTYKNSEIKFKMFNAKAEAHAKAGEEGIEIGAKAEADLVTVEGNGSIGNDDIKGIIQGKGTGLTAEAEAILEINKNKTEVGAKLGAYAAKGESSVTLELLGVKFTVFGGVTYGIGAEASAKTNYSSFGTKVGCTPLGLGLEGGYEIDYRDAHLPETMRKDRAERFLQEQRKLKRKKEAFERERKDKKGPDTEENRLWLKAEENIGAYDASIMEEIKYNLASAMVWEYMGEERTEGKENCETKSKEYLEKADWYIDLIRKHIKSRYEMYFEKLACEYKNMDEERYQYFVEKKSSLGKVVEYFWDEDVKQKLIDGTIVKELSKLQEGQVYNEIYPEDLHVVMDGATAEINKTLKELKHNVSGREPETNKWLVDYWSIATDSECKKITKDISSNVTKLPDFEKYKKFGEDGGVELELSGEELKKIKTSIKSMQKTEKLETIMQKTIDQFTNAMKKPFDRCFAMGEFSIGHLIKIDELRHQYRYSEMCRTEPQYKKDRIELAKEIVFNCMALNCYLEKVRMRSIELDRPEVAQKMLADIRKIQKNETAKNQENTKKQEGMIR